MSSALAAILPDRIGESTALQRQRSRQAARKVSTPFHVISPSVARSVANEHATGATNLAPYPNPTNVGALPERLAAALKRRVGDGNAITIKQLAYTLRVSDETVSQWMNGNRNPRGDHLLNLIAFFDVAFANEIMGGTGCQVVKLSDRRAIEAAEMIAQGAAILKAMEGR
jgi:transcriptional regulator with XRE-family HTH domain